MEKKEMNMENEAATQVSAYPFRNGYHPKTCKLVDLLKDGKEGQTLTDEKMSESIGINTAVGKPGYAYLNSAIRFVERNFSIVWKRVPKSGMIRCLNSEEKVDVVRSGIEHIHKTSKRMSRTSKSVNLNNIPEQDRPTALAIFSQVGAMAIMSETSTTKRLASGTIAAEIDRSRVYGLFAAMEK